MVLPDPEFLIGTGKDRLPVAGEGALYTLEKHAMYAGRSVLGPKQFKEHWLRSGIRVGDSSMGKGNLTELVACPNQSLKDHNESGETVHLTPSTSGCLRVADC